MKNRFFKIVVPIVFFFLSFTVYVTAQTTVVSAGIGASTLFDFNEDNSYRNSDYISGTNQFIKFEFQGFIPEANFLGLSVKLEQRAYQANILDHYPSFCGLDFTAYRPSFNHSITNRTLSIGLVPFNVSLGKDRTFRFGIEMAKSIGSTYNSLDIDSNQELNFGGVNDDPIQLTQKYFFDAMLEFRLGSIDINENVSVLSIVNIMVGISPETYTSAFTPRSIRSSIGFAVQRKMKPRID